ncbi:MAG: nucleotide-binding universal stress UspA family protein [Gammaproteobacteria bacterium]|jgi:nucleotide-binding universal stress UspA family protein
MTTPRKNDPIDSLAEAYEQMLERAVKDAHRNESKAERVLHELIHDARDKAVELGELTQHEAERLAKYLARDLSEATNYLAESGRELKDWLGFETSLLESEVIDLLLKAADDTTVDLILLNAAGQSRSKYLAGEITAPGTLICDGCGDKLRIRRTKEIPSCAACLGTSFHRRQT